MLRWYLHGGRRAAHGARNRAFGWLLVGVAARLRGDPARSSRLVAAARLSGTTRVVRHGGARSCAAARRVGRCCAHGAAARAPTPSAKLEPA